MSHQYRFADFPAYKALQLRTTMTEDNENVIRHYDAEGKLKAIYNVNLQEEIDKDPDFQIIVEAGDRLVGPKSNSES